MDFDHYAQIIDVKVNLPRPANEQYLSSRRALMRVSEDATKGAVYLACGLASCYLLYLSAEVLNVYLFSQLGAALAIFMVLALVVSALDIYTLHTAYMRIFQRETYGTARWADKAHLKQKELLTPSSQNPLPLAIPLGTFGFRHWLTVPLKIFMRHVLVVGPQGSGKTISFFINIMRAFLKVGGVIALDVAKNHGEVSGYTAHYAKNVFRFDLVNPECSDRFSLRACKGNPALAYDVACFMVGYDPNNKGGGGGENPVWPQAASALLKCMLLHMHDVMEHPTPGDIFAYIAAHPYDPEEKVDHLKEAMLASKNPDVHEAWSMFERIDFKVRSSVYFSMATPMEPFKDPAVKRVMSMPTPEEAARGCRVIDFKELRKQGTIIYAVVREGQASRMAPVLATFFGVALDVLRNSADDAGACPTLVSLDEAANVPFKNLAEDLAVGRGRKIAFMLGYQNVSQMAKQFGEVYARVLRQLFAVRIFLPGLVDETADLVVKLLGKTTGFQRSSNDAVGRALDSERVTEIARDLMDTTALREMLPYRQAVAVVETAHPIRLGFPPDASVVDPRRSIPVRYDMEYAGTAEAARLYGQMFGLGVGEKSPVELVIEGEGGQHPALMTDTPAKLLTEGAAAAVGVTVPQSPAQTPQVFAPRVEPPPQTLSPFFQIPFAPVRPDAVLVVAPAPPAHAPPAEAAPDAVDEQEAPVQYAEEVVVEAQSAPPAVSAHTAQLSQMLESPTPPPQAPAHSAGVDPDEQAAMIDALEQSEQFVTDFDV